MLSQILLLTAALACNSVKRYDVIATSGRYQLPNSPYCVELFVDEGDILSARILPGRKVPPHGTNVTGIAWLSNHEIVYSQSAVYGVGGLFRYDARDGRERWLVPAHPPRNTTEELNGYFKLISVTPTAIEYWFTPDISRIDEGNLGGTAERRIFHFP